MPLVLISLVSQSKAAADYTLLKLVALVTRRGHHNRLSGPPTGPGVRPPGFLEAKARQAGQGIFF